MPGPAVSRAAYYAWQKEFDAVERVAPVAGKSE